MQSSALAKCRHEKFLNLVTERVFLDDNPPTKDQGTDRPGRSFKRENTNRRSSMETADWHELEQHRFARRVAAPGTTRSRPERESTKT
jgi:hypothetical protein